MWDTSTKPIIRNQNQPCFYHYDKSECLLQKKVCLLQAMIFEDWGNILDYRMFSFIFRVLNIKYSYTSAALFLLQLLSTNSLPLTFKDIESHWQLWIVVVLKCLKTFQSLILEIGFNNMCTAEFLIFLLGFSCSGIRGSVVNMITPSNSKRVREN